MKIPLSVRTSSPTRTLNSLQADHLRFETQGKGDVKNKAKLYNNVIGSQLFDIPLTQVHFRAGFNILLIHVHALL